jgi:hypothetical protein
MDLFLSLEDESCTTVLPKLDAFIVVDGAAAEVAGVAAEVGGLGLKKEGVAVAAGAGAGTDDAGCVDVAVAGETSDAIPMPLLDCAAAAVDAAVDPGGMAPNKPPARDAGGFENSDEPAGVLLLAAAVVPGVGFAAPNDAPDAPGKESGVAAELAFELPVGANEAPAAGLDVLSAFVVAGVVDVNEKGRAEGVADEEDAAGVFPRLVPPPTPPNMGAPEKRPGAAWVPEVGGGAAGVVDPRLKILLVAGVVEPMGLGVLFCPSPGLLPEPPLLPPGATEVEKIGVEVLVEKLKALDGGADDVADPEAAAVGWEAGVAPNKLPFPPDEGAPKLKLMMD